MPVGLAGVSPAGRHLATPGPPLRIRPVVNKMPGLPTAWMAVLPTTIRACILTVDAIRFFLLLGICLDSFSLFMTKEQFRPAARLIAHNC